MNSLPKNTNLLFIHPHVVPLYFYLSENIYMQLLNIYMSVNLQKLSNDYENSLFSHILILLKLCLDTFFLFSEKHKNHK